MAENVSADMKLVVDKMVNNKQNSKNINVNAMEIIK